jgi:hypothetical protein
MIAAFHFVLALLICVSLPEIKRRGNSTAAILYLMLAFATVVWVSRSVQWPQ